MPVKINELVIQVKVSQTSQQAENPEGVKGLSSATSQDQTKLLLSKVFLDLLEDQQTR